MMHIRVAAAMFAVVCASAGAAAAQGVETMLPVPPLPSIGLPLPHIGLPPAEKPPTGVATPPSGPRTPVGPGIQQTLPAYYPPMMYLAPWYFLPSAPPAVTRTEAPAGRSATRPDEAEPRPTGTLWLDLQPNPPMQVFVDGYYIGTTDTTGNTLELEAGPHNIDLRADGYESVTFDVRITPRQSISYRARLKATDASNRPAPASSPAPTTLYVIPGCYAGNEPPDPASLPEGCDPAQLTTLHR